MYWGEKAIRNVIDYFCYISFFPALISGPISGSEYIEEYKKDKIVKWTCFREALERIVLGLFKKLVLANRLSLITDGIHSNYVNLGSIYLILGILVFPLQLYCDFSGCMDIVLGVAKLFDINLPENFDHPFQSQSIAEFWRRWHITLGGWLRKYIYYPVLKSGWMNTARGYLANAFGKKVSKIIVNVIALALTWTVVGIWHGPDFKYVFYGWLFGFYIIVEETLKIYKKGKERTFAAPKVNTVFVYMLVSVTLLFFWTENVAEGIAYLKQICCLPNMMQTEITFVGTISEMFVLASMLFIYATYGKLMRKIEENGNAFFRIFFLMSMVTVVLIFGIYGNNIMGFIYNGF